MKFNTQKENLKKQRGFSFVSEILFARKFEAFVRNGFSDNLRFFLLSLKFSEEDSSEYESSSEEESEVESSEEEEASSEEVSSDEKSKKKSKKSKKEKKAKKEKKEKESKKSKERVEVKREPNSFERELASYARDRNMDKASLHARAHAYVRSIIHYEFILCLNVVFITSIKPFL